MKEQIENEAPKQKERHIVTWTQQEDDILRNQINIHGTENWAIIASKFTDKTTRQCRRRWYTYLNSDFKKGGWTPEEDMLLCEAQKAFGNRWTEIAKVVSGRTDNAVKNRFSTLCKRKAKCEALAKENNSSYINLNKRILHKNELNTDRISGSAVSSKKMRMTHITNVTKNCNNEEKLRPPLAELDQNFHKVENLTTGNYTSNTMEASSDVHSDKNQGVFLKKDDPKIIALMQQAELLSSLAIKVNTESTDQCLENAWKILQDFLNKNKENDTFRCEFPDMDFQFECFKDLIEDFRSSKERIQASSGKPDLHEEFPGSSEYSTGSTNLSQTAVDKTDRIIGAQIQSNRNIQQNRDGESNNGTHYSPITNQGNGFMACHESDNTEGVGVLSALSSKEYGSPVQVTPVFRSLAAGIPSPIFSESERNFLMKTLGVESSSPHHPSDDNCSKPVNCKRALLQSL